jgi:uncharacterized membrane protein
VCVCWAPANEEIQHHAYDWQQENQRNPEQLAYDLGTPQQYADDSKNVQEQDYRSNQTQCRWQHFSSPSRKRSNVKTQIVRRQAI